MKLLNVSLLLASIVVITYTHIYKKESFDDVKQEPINTLNNEVLTKFLTINNNDSLLNIDNNEKVNDTVLTNYINHVLNQKDCNVQPENDLYRVSNYDLEVKIALKKLHQFFKLNAIKLSLRRINELSNPVNNK